MKSFKLTYVFGLFLLMGLLTNCEKEPEPLSSSEYSILSDYVKGTYYGASSTKIMDGVIIEWVLSEILIKNDSLVYEAREEQRNRSLTNFSDDQRSITELNRGKIKFTKQFNEYGHPEIRVDFERFVIYDSERIKINDFESQTIHGRPTKIQGQYLDPSVGIISMDSLFLELKEKNSKSANFLGGISVSKYKYQTDNLMYKNVDYKRLRLSDFNIETSKVLLKKHLSSIDMKDPPHPSDFLDSIKKTYRPEFLQSFVIEKLDKFQNFIREKYIFSPSKYETWRLNKQLKIDEEEFKEDYKSLWMEHLEKGVINFTKLDKWEYVDTNSLYFYENRQYLDGFEIKIDVEKIDFDEERYRYIFWDRKGVQTVTDPYGNLKTTSDGNLYVVFPEPFNWANFPLTEESVSSLTSLLSPKNWNSSKDYRNISDCLLSAPYRMSEEAKNMLVYPAQASANNSRLSITLNPELYWNYWNFHWDKKTKLLRMWNSCSSEYLILKSLGR